MPASKADIQISKTGPNGRPVAQIIVDATASLGSVTATIQKQITRNSDLYKKLGLKACGSCISGFDIDIRHRYEQVMQVDLENVG